MITITDLSVRIGQATLVKSVSAGFEKGRLYGLVGPNGSGKTTLIKAMTGLIDRSAGDIDIDGLSLDALSLLQRATRIGYLPQDRGVAWDLTALEVVALGAITLSSADAEARAIEMLTRVGMQDFAGRGVFSLSGGQRARVLLARLLATACQTLLLDEPLTALDPAWQRQTLKVLKSMASAGHTVIASLHDLGLAVQMCDEVCVMKEGALKGCGEPQKVFTPGLLRDVFNLSGEVSEGQGGPILHIDPTPLDLTA